MYYNYFQPININAFMYGMQNNINFNNSFQYMTPSTIFSTPQYYPNNNFYYTDPNFLIGGYNNGGYNFNTLQYNSIVTPKATNVNNSSTNELNNLKKIASEVAENLSGREKRVLEDLINDRDVTVDELRREINRHREGLKEALLNPSSLTINKQNLLTILTDLGLKQANTIRKMNDYCKATGGISENNITSLGIDATNVLSFINGVESFESLNNQNKFLLKKLENELIKLAEKLVSDNRIDPDLENSISNCLTRYRVDSEVTTFDDFKNLYTLTLLASSDIADKKMEESFNDSLKGLINDDFYTSEANAILKAKGIDNNKIKEIKSQTAEYKEDQTRYKDKNKEIINTLNLSISNWETEDADLSKENGIKATYTDASGNQTTYWIKNGMLLKGNENGPIAGATDEYQSFKDNITGLYNLDPDNLPEKFKNVTCTFNGDNIRGTSVTIGKLLEEDVVDYRRGNEIPLPICESTIDSFANALKDSGYDSAIIKTAAENTKALYTEFCNNARFYNSTSQKYYTDRDEFNYNDQNYYNIVVAAKGDNNYRYNTAQKMLAEDATNFRDENREEGLPTGLALSENNAEGECIHISYQIILKHFLEQLQLAAKKAQNGN